MEAVLREPGYMVEQFRPFKGGLIARQYPQPRDIGIPPEQHRAIYDAFMAAGCR